MKTKDMQEHIVMMQKAIFGRGSKDGECIACGAHNLEFSEAIYAREYGISHMCEKCQNKVFKPQRRKAK